MKRAVFLLTMTISSAISSALDRATAPKGKRLYALVYRGPAASAGCPESAAALLESSHLGIDVDFVGPSEDIELTAKALRHADIYVQPGGDGLDESWPHMRTYRSVMQDYVHNGGRYIGICLGAYMAGHNPGFDLLDPDDDANEEVSRRGAQVKNPDEDTVIQVDWHFASGRVDKGRWLYFQDGAAFKLDNNSSARVLGRYSSNGDVAAAVSKFGRGYVGVIGPHPEADEESCQSRFVYYHQTTRY